MSRKKCDVRGRYLETPSEVTGYVDPLLVDAGVLKVSERAEASVATMVNSMM